VIVVNKSDLTPRDGLVEEVRRIAVGIPAISVSALYGSGLADLETVLVDLVTRGAGVHIEAAMVANARHEKCLLDAREALDRAINALEADVPYDLTSIDIRAAADALGGITGETASEEIVEAIFSRFCIGK
jgi:tRNA modification GTPase